MADGPGGSQGRGGASSAKGLPSVSVVVPAYNEARIIEPNLTRLCAYLESIESRFRWELVVVNDGSSDATGALASAFARGRGQVRILEHSMNFRLGQALRYGFSASTGDYVVAFDLDLTYAPEHIERLLSRIHETGAKIVVASPYMRGGRTSGIPLHRRVLSRCANWFLALTARGSGPTGVLTTITGMVRAYDRKFLRSLNLKSMGAEINTEIIYKAMILGARVEEIPAHLDWSAFEGPDKRRASSTRIRRSIVFSLFAGFIMRPFAFFIFPSVALGLVALYVLGWLCLQVYTYYQTTPSSQIFDYRFSAALKIAFEQSPHAFVVGGVTLLLSVQFFSLGVLSVQVKRYFEEMFHFGTRILRQAQDLEERDRNEDTGRQGA